MLASAAFLNPFTTSTAPPPLTRLIHHSDISHKLRPPVVDPNKFLVRFDDEIHDRMGHAADYPYFPDDFVPSESGWVGMNVDMRQKTTTEVVTFPDDKRTTVRKQIFRTDNHFERGQVKEKLYFLFNQISRH